MNSQFICFWSKIPLNFYFVKDIITLFLLLE